MERRKALATAGAVGATALAAVIALGANVGLFGLTGHDGGPGNFKVVDSTRARRPEVTQVIDVPVPVTSTGSDTGVAGTPEVGDPSRSPEVGPDAEPRVGDDGRSEPARDEDD